MARESAEMDALNSAFDTWWARVELPPQNFVYLMYDAYGHLLYVGITNNLRNRLSAHYAEKPWIGEVAKIEVERYDTREESKTRESYLIADRGPLFNIAENAHLENAVSYFTWKITEECPAAQPIVARMMETVDLEYENAR